MGYEEIKLPEQLSKETSEAAIKKAEEAILAMNLTDEEIEKLNERLRNRRETQVIN